MKIFFWTIFILFIFGCNTIFATTSLFERASKSVAFVDKTLMLKTYFERIDDYARVIFTMPKRFGKSTNLDMIRRFLENATHDKSRQERNKQLFKNHNPTFKIMEHKTFVDKHFGKYPIVFIDLFMDLTSIQIVTVDMLFENIIWIFRTVFLKYEWLYIEIYQNHTIKEPKDHNNQIRDTFELFLSKENESYIMKHKLFPRALFFLGSLLKQYYGCPPILMVDEYDSPLSNAILKGVNIQEVANTFKTIWTNALKGDYAPFELAIMTGVTGISVATGLSSLSFKHLGFLSEHPFTYYYGFQKDEMETLFKKFGITNKEIQSLISSFYNGYTTFRNKYTFYNPESVTTFLLDITEEMNRNDITDFFPLLKIRRPLLVTGKLHPNLGDLIVFGNLINISVCKESVQFKYFPDISVNDWNILCNFKSVAWQNINRILGRSYVDVYFSYLVQIGDLIHDSEKQDYFKAPNEEVREEIKQQIISYLIEVYPEVSACYYNVTSSVKKIVEESNISRLTINETKAHLQTLFERYASHKKRLNPSITFKEVHFQAILHFILDSSSTFYYTNMEENMDKGEKNYGEVDVVIISKDRKTILIIEFKLDVTQPEFNTAIQNQLLKYHPKKSFEENCLGNKVRLKYLLINVKLRKDNTCMVEIAYNPGNYHLKDTNTIIPCDEEPIILLDQRKRGTKQLISSSNKPPSDLITTISSVTTEKELSSTACLSKLLGRQGHS